MRTPLSRAIARFLPVFLGLLFLLAACTAAPGTATSVVTPTSTTTPTAAVAVTSTPTAQPATGAAALTRVSSATATATAAASASPTASPGPSTAAAAAADVTAAIKAVIQRANQAQQRAFAAQDPTLMRDTATDDYYAELAQTNQDLAANGVTAIALVDLQWGAITQQGATSVEATTIETWRTTYSDGSTEQASEQNVYTLVQVGGAWQIQADAHPDTATVQPATGSAGAGTSPQSTAPTTTGDASKSSNWSGYAAAGGTFTAVAGTWTVPTVAAGTGNGADAAWVGIGGVTSTDLIQAGTEATVVGNTVRYDAWVELLPRASQQVPLTVNPGDQISVAIAQQADGTWLVAFQNLTTGQQYQVTETYTSSRSSAEWVEEAPSSGRGIIALDNFGTVRFQAASAVEDGRTVSIAQAGGIAITMINRTGQALAIPSALDADGAGFGVQRSAIAPTTPASPTAPGRGRSTTGTPAVP